MSTSHLDGTSIHVMVTDALDKQYTKHFIYYCDNQLEAINKCISEVNYNGYTLRQIVGIDAIPSKDFVKEYFNETQD